MNALKLPVKASSLLILTLSILTQTTAYAQREYTVVKPRERAANEKVDASRRATKATTGILIVVLDPVISGKVEIYDARGKVIEQADVDAATGQVEFELRRGQTYVIKAASPGYTKVEGRKLFNSRQDVVRLKLNAMFARLSLPGLPPGTEIFIDDVKKAETKTGGQLLLDSLEPGRHTLLVRHPEYNDYKADLGKLEAGNEVNFPPLGTILVKVAKLAIQGPPGAIVLIDGAVQGRIGNDGKVNIDYQIDKAAERTITVEQVGYQTWSSRELLSPGPRPLTVRLEPIVTSTGVSDFFDTLSLWNPSPTWTLANDGRNKRLQVKGEQLGVLKDKTYRDCQAVFTVWLTDGKGASWVIKADKTGRSYYLFHLAGPSSTTHTPNRFYTYLIKDGAAPVEVSTPAPVLAKLSTTVSYTINLSVQDYTVRHSIVSNETAETDDLGIWTDTSVTKDRFLYGTFGFRSLAGEVFIVDDFNIEPIQPK